MSDRERRDDDGTMPLVITRSGGGGGKGGHGKLLDAHAAMPGAIKRAGGDKPASEEGAVALPGGSDKAALRRRYFEYVHHLANPADGDGIGDPVPALARAFGIKRAEAEERQIELHDALTSAARTMTFGDALRAKSVDVSARVARLADHAYHPDPKVSLVALKVLNDMDDGATSSAEETIEDHIAGILDGDE